MEISVTIRLAELPQDLSDIYTVRYQVFQLEQGIEPSLEFDGKDLNAIHILAHIGKRAIGTVRIRILNNGQTAKLERVAVLSGYRGQGIGSHMVDLAVNLLIHQGIPQVVLHAQLPTEHFYQQLGFTRLGEPFTEAGIPHVKMGRDLPVSVACDQTPLLALAVS